MRTIFTIACLLLLLISCKQSESTENKDANTQETLKKKTLEGTWELIGYYNYSENKVQDSFEVLDGLRQIKMFTSSRVMWSKSLPKDSTEWFGYGHYNSTDTTLTEELEYSSKAMKKILEDKKIFHFELQLEENNYMQIELDEDGNRIYSENYKRVE